MEDNNKIIYRPDIQPKRHYESDATFEKTPSRVFNDPIPWTPTEEVKKSEVDELLADLKTVYNLLPYFPIQIRPIIETMIITITTDTIVRIDPPDPETPYPPEPEILNNLFRSNLKFRRHRNQLLLNQSLIMTIYSGSPMFRLSILNKNHLKRSISLYIDGQRVTWFALRNIGSIS